MHTSMVLIKLHKASIALVLKIQIYYFTTSVLLLFLAENFYLHNYKHMIKSQRWDMAQLFKL